MIHLWENCHETSTLLLYIESKLDRSILENDENVKLRAMGFDWSSHNRKSNKAGIWFLEILIKETDKLNTQHYIAWNQSNYLEHKGNTKRNNHTRLYWEV